MNVCVFWMSIQQLLLSEEYTAVVFAFPWELL